MPVTLDVFNSSQFSMVELTKSIDIVPNVYGRLQELGVFPGEPVSTTNVLVEYNNGVLNLLTQQPRGGDQGSVGKPEKRTMKSFLIPHIPHDDKIMAADVQNIRAFGQTSELDQVQTMVNRRLMRMRMRHALTLEYLRMGALKGVVIDADGSTIVDFFSEFGVAQKVVDFALGTAGTNVDAKCMEVKRHMEVNLLGETMTGVRALCSPEWFDKFVSHPNVKDAYKYYQSVQEPLREDVRTRFRHKGIEFEEYPGQGTVYNADGTLTTRRFIPAGDVRFFPEGTMETFGTYFAPADFIETVNTPGQEIYVKMAPDAKYQKFVEIHTQSNPLPICRRPALLVRGHSSD